MTGRENMQRILILLLLAMPLLALLYYVSQSVPEQEGELAESGQVSEAEEREPPTIDALPKKAVLDITVHTIDELKVLLDRAEELAMVPQPPGEEASVVLVLHGPEVEFFSISNYERYKDIVDQAARLDAFDVVDVKICQTMMEVKGIPRADIPSFIEQVPQGPAEVERLVREGYVYF
jgi:intracellular sulfur oxidation DsrE/DsrF family protein